MGTIVLTMVGAAPEPHRYANGFSITVSIAENLYQALPAKMGDQVDPRPLNMLASDQPFIGPVALTDENKTSREVSISVGMIDLLNHLAHAKAVDNIEPGFFARYVKNISLQSGDQLDLPDIVDARYWTESVRNDQMSYFNQMASMLMAINLSHHYLGHYTKYGPKLPRANDLMLPINQFLTPEEWEASVKAGAVNSLSCALATSGVQALFEAIDAMPHRPAWAGYIVPQSANLKGLNKELGAYEDSFYHGKLAALNTN